MAGLSKDAYCKAMEEVNENIKITVQTLNEMGEGGTKYQQRHFCSFTVGILHLSKLMEAQKNLIYIWNSRGRGENKHTSKTYYTPTTVVCEDHVSEAKWSEECPFCKLDGIRNLVDVLTAQITEARKKIREE